MLAQRLLVAVEIHLTAEKGDSFSGSETFSRSIGHVTCRAPAPAQKVLMQFQRISTTFAVVAGLALVTTPSFAASGDAASARKPQMSPWPVTLVDAFRPLNEIQILPRSQATGWVKAVGMIRNPELAMPSTAFIVNECKSGEPSYEMDHEHFDIGVLLSPIKAKVAAIIQQDEARNPVHP